MARFKGKNGEINVMLVLVEKTKSGFLVRKWVNRLIGFLGSNVKNNMVVLKSCETNSSVMDIWNLNFVMRDDLEKLCIVKGALIPDDLNIEDKYSVHR